MANHPVDTNPNSANLGKLFYSAIRNNCPVKAAEYLSDMTKLHLKVYPDNDTALQVFLSAHLVSAFDLADLCPLEKLMPIDRIIRSEILRYHEEYQAHSDPVMLLVHHTMHKVNTLLGLEASPASGKMDKVKQYVDEYYSSPELTVTDLSIRFDLSLGYLSRTFKATLGVGLNDYIHLVRIAHAKALLSTTDLSVSEVASAVGYTGSSAFIRAFRNIENTTPGSFRSLKYQLV